MEAFGFPTTFARAYRLFEIRYRNDGYSLVGRVWQEVHGENAKHLDLSLPGSLELLALSNWVTVPRLMEMIEGGLELGIFDRAPWEEHRYLTSDIIRQRAEKYEDFRARTNDNVKRHRAKRRGAKSKEPETPQAATQGVTDYTSITDEVVTDQLNKVESNKEELNEVKSISDRERDTESLDSKNEERGPLDPYSELISPADLTLIQAIARKERIDFQALFRSWLDSLRTRGVGIDRFLVQAQLQFLANIPSAEASIRQSMRHGWKSLHQVKEDAHPLPVANEPVVRRHPRRPEENSDRSTHDFVHGLLKDTKEQIKRGTSNGSNDEAMRDVQAGAASDL